MNILPSETFQLRTAKTAKAVTALLKANTAQPKPIRTAAVGTLFEGSLEGDRFRLRRVTRIRSSFLPQISGTIGRDGEGARLDVRLNLSPYLVGVGLVWFGLSLFLLAAGLLNLPGVRGELSAAQYFSAPAGMLALGVALFIIPFRLEARRIKALLRNLLEANPA
ncbi:MAG: hypothetical protein A2087_09760 [Spirochaetes bacterium GWD1_61_31]|nr:MAG: hypothetical protein A2Y37_10245 [Spirochaetes bacterium GWB1_60_80]OHD29039.1 MAG: hypothetical protein A2004_14395 [Spirochaetes bacterium GWC1_61_12]OHD35598.1 MAG: hypothetical protein A2087_09760 [Spirochaetes bacterium GWD1_61_31]OHD44205.1 MAG: hypothetical protein A2Y35_06600 [Spirochaetes bacterium GWE1_60_18]OHD60435.1 MAG: hypothetical protein A2Y32_00925 [Spirochaetes bacterium GWF1_60_12]HAP44461.1 hypothetical protein [Spirochaetaceae bacterium]